MPPNYELGDFIYEPNPSQQDIDELNRYLLISFCVIVLLGVIGGYIYILSKKLSISNASLAEANSKLLKMAHFDELTKIPNRVLLYDRLEQGLAQANRKGMSLALMVIDLDKFKPINDTYGHDVGDHVLQLTAAKMEHAIRKTDTVGRIGGDEFVILLPEIGSIENALEVAAKALEAVSQPICIGGLTLTISASIGIAIFPEHGTSQIELYKNADEAMYLAKNREEKGIQLYHPKPTEN